MTLIMPVESDYPETMFRSDLPPEMRVGCAWAYFRTNPIARRLFRRRVETTFAMIPSRTWKRALDAGTGAGFLLPGLAAMAGEVVGSDISPVIRYTQVMLDRRGLRNTRLHSADLLALPYPAGSFDLIVCLSVIEHIPDLQGAFTEMARVMTPDGVLILGYPLEHPLFEAMEWLIRKERRLQRVLRGQAAARGKAFHPHTSHYRGIERTADATFRMDERRTISILGVPVYRISRLTRGS